MAPASEASSGKDSTEHGRGQDRAAGARHSTSMRLGGATTPASRSPKCCFRRYLLRCSTLGAVGLQKRWQDIRSKGPLAFVAKQSPDSLVCFSVLACSGACSAVFEVTGTVPSAGGPELDGGLVQLLAIVGMASMCLGLPWCEAEVSEGNRCANEAEVSEGNRCAKSSPSAKGGSQNMPVELPAAIAQVRRKRAT